MPFKGDMRLGGPHDNERTLNGTSSDFDGVPAYGTFLRGPEDTSREESDFVGNLFQMPYETNWYADGLGGEYPVEVWGLQYFPAGWVTNRVDIVNENFYVEELDVTVTWQTFATDSIEDGTGINYESTVVYYQASQGDVIGDTSYYVTYLVADEERVEVYGEFYYPQRTKVRCYHDGSGGYYSEQLGGSYVEYQPSGTLINAQIQVKTEMPPDRDLADGLAPHMADYWNGKYRSAYWNGSGGYTASAPTGNFLPNGTAYYTAWEAEHTEVPELNGQGIDQGSMFFNGGVQAVNYCWNGSGGAGTTTSVLADPYYPYATPIGTDGAFYYYWDGAGGYYQVEINPPDPPPEDPPPEE